MDVKKYNFSLLWMEEGECSERALKWVSSFWHPNRCTAIHSHIRQSKATQTRSAERKTTNKKFKQALMLGCPVYVWEARGTWVLGGIRTRLRPGMRACFTAALIAMKCAMFQALNVWTDRGRESIPSKPSKSYKTFTHFIALQFQVNNSEHILEFK